jgi:hypothetical protein
LLARTTNQSAVVNYHGHPSQEVRQEAIAITLLHSKYVVERGTRSSPLAKINMLVVKIFIIARLDPQPFGTMAIVSERRHPIHPSKLTVRESRGWSKSWP